jgi:hypothetical protein
VLLGSASYYLCDLPGSASVLAKRIDDNCPDLDGDGLEDLLLWLLQVKLGTYFEGTEGTFGEFIDSISRFLHQFFDDGTGEDNIFDLAISLREAVYRFGTPRQLLFGDVIVAVLRKKVENSSWKALPLYSGLPRDKWLHALRKDTLTPERAEGCRVTFQELQRGFVGSLAIRQSRNQPEEHPIIHPP